jgi:hypothetical protein
MNAIKIDADFKRFPEAKAFVEEVFERRHVNASIAYETMQLFEALFSKIVFQVGEQDAEIEISSLNGLGHTDIKLVFPGKRFSVSDGDAFVDPEAKIIEAFSDKVSCSYFGGYNVIRISLAKAPRPSFFRTPSPSLRPLS